MNIAPFTSNSGYSDSLSVDVGTEVDGETLPNIPKLTSNLLVPEHVYRFYRHESLYFLPYNLWFKLRPLLGSSWQVSQEIKT